MMLETEWSGHGCDGVATLGECLGRADHVLIVADPTPSLLTAVTRTVGETSYAIVRGFPDLVAMTELECYKREGTVIAAKDAALCSMLSTRARAAAAAGYRYSVVMPDGGIPLPLLSGRIVPSIVQASGVYPRYACPDIRSAQRTLQGCTTGSVVGIVIPHDVFVAAPDLLLHLLSDTAAVCGLQLVLTIHVVIVSSPRTLFYALKDCVFSALSVDVRGVECWNDALTLAAEAAAVVREIGEGVGLEITAAWRDDPDRLIVMWATLIAVMPAGDVAVALGYLSKKNKTKKNVF